MKIVFNLNQSKQVKKNSKFRNLRISTDYDPANSIDNARLSKNKNISSSDSIRIHLPRSISKNSNDESKKNGNKKNNQRYKTLETEANSELKIEKITRYTHSNN